MSPNATAAAPLRPEDFTIETLGAAVFPNPCGAGVTARGWVDEARRVRYDVVTPPAAGADDLGFELAGPRARLFFDPARAHAAIVTCGGLSPGLNAVIRAVYFQLRYQYGVPRVSGIPHGYEGFDPRRGEPLIALTHDGVDHIMAEGGTVLGAARGNPPVEVMVDILARERIDLLFTVGGDGTQRGAAAIAAELRRRALPVAVVGIPKTIDNDIAFVYKTFGFDTAVSIAVEAIANAHTEAHSYPRGVGLVKLMGRDSGFIAAYATIASGDVNAVLVPEVPFALEGPGGLLAWLDRRLDARDHAVIVVAEGAGQELCGTAAAGTAAGAPQNVAYKDIGLYLKDRIETYFKTLGKPVSLKYIDPGYMIRAASPNAPDRLLCQNLGQAAVHAALAGKTNLLVGLWHGILVHVPIPLATRFRKRIRTDSGLWASTRAATGQPAVFG